MFSTINTIWKGLRSKANVPITPSAITSETQLLTGHFVSSASCSLTLSAVVVLLDSSQPLWSLLALWLVVFAWAPSLTSSVAGSHCSFVAFYVPCLILFRPLLLYSGCLRCFVPWWDLWLVSQLSYVKKKQNVTYWCWGANGLRTLGECP